MLSRQGIQVVPLSLEYSIAVVLSMRSEALSTVSTGAAPRTGTVTVVGSLLKESSVAAIRTSSNNGGITPGTTIYVRLVDDGTGKPGPVVMEVLPERPAAPDVKVNPFEFTMNTTTGMEYSHIGVEGDDLLPVVNLIVQPRVGHSPALHTLAVRGGEIIRFLHPLGEGVGGIRGQAGKLGAVLPRLAAGPP